MKIIGTGRARPEFTLTNDMLSEIMDTSDQWIKERTGIRKRQIITSEELEDLAAESAKKALENAGMTANNIDYIICSTSAYEYVVPSLSCIVEGMIGADCPCIDVNAACTGFIYAIDLAESLLVARKDINNILIICADQPTRMVDWTDRSTSVLFGDGAGSIVVTKGNKLKSIKVNSKSNVGILKYKRCLEPTPFITKDEKDAPLSMSGQDVFKNAVSASVSDIKSVMESAEITKESIDYYIVHQANIRIIDSIRHHLDEDPVKFPHNIENYGNTSSASIPILLDELNRTDCFSEGDIIVFSAFGAGFTSGACVIEW